MTQYDKYTHATIIHVLADLQPVYLSESLTGPLAALLDIAWNALEAVEMALERVMTEGDHQEAQEGL